MSLALVRVVVAAGTAAGLLLSPNLWLSARSYPTVPVWAALPDAPPLVGAVVYAALLVLLVLVATLPRRWPVLAFVGLAAGWCLWDQTRWQPWVYQYLAFFAAAGTVRREADALAACRFVLAATYFWSGVQKLNASFVTDLYPWLIVPVQRLLPAGPAGWLAGQGWLVAAGEAGLGVMLFVPRLRAVAVPLVVVMHLGLLYCLGPFGHDWNSVVWPWNLTLAGLVVVLFGHAAPPGRPGWPVVLLFGVMPAFSFVGWWDSYLSASLYSGTTPRATITLDAAAVAALPPDVAVRFVTDGEVYLQGWAMAELNVPGYPARRVFRGLARRLAGPGAARLVTHDRPDPRTGQREDIEEQLGP